MNKHCTSGSKKKGKVPFRVIMKEPVAEVKAVAAIDEQEDQENPLAEDVLGFVWEDFCDHRPTKEEQELGKVIRACRHDNSP